MDSNIYFALTAEFNAKGRIAILASGQAVVYYRLAMMSKDGDCVHVREVFRLFVVQEVAVEVDQWQNEDRRRVEKYAEASSAYLRAVSLLEPDQLTLPDSHQRLCGLAEELLPQGLEELSGEHDADAE